MSRARPRFAALTAMIAVLLAGCGSAGLSTRQLRRAATQICAAAGRRTARIPAPDNPSGGRVFLERGVSALTPELMGLRRLRAPQALASAYATALGALGRQLSLLRAAIQRLAHGADPVSELRALQRRLAPLEAREDAAWHAVDVPICLSR
jgi:hypothetical protein